jgi:hypothetical protein
MDHRAGPAPVRSHSLAVPERKAQPRSKPQGQLLRKEDLSINVSDWTNHRGPGPGPVQTGLVHKPGPSRTAGPARLEPSSGPTQILVHALLGPRGRTNVGLVHGLGPALRPKNRCWSGWSTIVSRSRVRSGAWSGPVGPRTARALGRYLRSRGPSPGSASSSMCGPAHGVRTGLSSPAKRDLRLPRIGPCVSQSGSAERRRP